MAESNELMKSVKKSITDIALDRLKENSKGFYGIDFGFDGTTGSPWLKAEAGIRVADWLKLSGVLRYDPASGKIIAGGHLGGEISL